VSLVVLLILAVVWGVFLVPQVLRARADRGPADSIGSFRNQLSMIERTAATTVAPGRYARPAPLGGGVIGGSYAIRQPFAPPTRAELQRRRQNVLLGLLAAVIVTLALGLVWTPLFAVNVLADLALGAYVALLVRARTIAAEREVKVRYLRGPALVSAPAHGAEPALRSIAR
jgi:type II secretory pathway component PulM